MKLAERINTILCEPDSNFDYQYNDGQTFSFVWRDDKSYLDYAIYKGQLLRPDIHSQNSCFARGTIYKNGILPVEEYEMGDQILTHKQIQVARDFLLQYVSKHFGFKLTSMFINPQ
jgi:hypothetical protein